MGMLDRLDRRNRRLVHEQMERDPTRLIPAGVVAVVSGGAVVWIAFWTAMALAGAGSSGWAALLAVIGVGVIIVLLRDVIADLRDLAARRRPRQKATSSPERG